MNTLRPFYFTVVFWGAEHRGYFTDLLLASLLSPYNIPALNKERQNKFLIVTTKEDWALLQNHHLFQQLHKYMEAIFFEMPFPTKQDSKMLVMSQGHKQVAMRAYQDQAYGVFVTPDLILSDGSVVAMERLAEEGKKVVLCIAIRFRQETMIAAMKSEGFLNDSKPLVISSRQLMKLALCHLHSETLRYEFDASYFADSPISIYWWASDSEAMIIYSFSWAPLVVDYGTLEQHDTKTFEKWTLDGDYIYRNFPNANDVHVITDSDEISLVSFTKESELHFDLIPQKKNSDYGVFSETYKVSLMRALKDSDVMDPLKRAIFSKPVILHWTGRKDKWNEKLRETNLLIAQACRPSNLEEQFMMDVIEQATSSKFSRMVLDEMKSASTQEVLQQIRSKYFLTWLCVIRPRRLLMKAGRCVQGKFRPITNQFWGAIWAWRYRRFMWWRLKEKIGVVETRGYDWNQGDWYAPGVSLMCPLFTLNWVWRNRKFFWNERHTLLARFNNRYSRDQLSETRDVGRYSPVTNQQTIDKKIGTHEQSMTVPCVEPNIPSHVVSTPHGSPASKE